MKIEAFATLIFYLSKVLQNFICALCRSNLCILDTLLEQSTSEFYLCILPVKLFASLTVYLSMTLQNFTCALCHSNLCILDALLEQSTSKFYLCIMSVKPLHS